MTHCLQNVDALAPTNDAEEQLVKATREESQCDFLSSNNVGDNSSEQWGRKLPVIRAEVVTAILSGQAPKRWGIPPRAPVRLRGARIDGDIFDLDGCELAPFWLTACRFDGRVDLGGATCTGEAAFDQSRFVGEARFKDTTFGDDAKFLRTFFNDRAVFYRATMMRDAHFHDARFTTGGEFERAKFGGDARFNRVQFNGAASFERVQFDGNAEFGDDGNDPADEGAWPSYFCGVAEFSHASFGRNARFKSTFAQEAHFYRATFARDADFYKATFNSKAQFQWAIFGGNAQFDGATFGAAAEFPNASFERDAKFGGANFRGATHCNAGAEFYEATVKGNAFFSGAHFESMARFERAEFVRDVDFANATFQAEAQLCGASVTKTANFANTTFQPPASMMANNFEAGTLMMRFNGKPDKISLHDARIGVIQDKQDAWPEDRDLGGCQYCRLEADPKMSVKERIRWVDPRLEKSLKSRLNDRITGRLQEQKRCLSPRTKMTSKQRVTQFLWRQREYDPARYNQLILAYRNAGDEPQANRVALAKQRARRGALTPLGRFWGYIQDYLVGYGYRLGLALGWIAVLIAAAWWVFGQVNPHPTSQRPPHFHALIYASDLLFPGANFGHKVNFEFDGWRLWFSYGLMVAGWILAAAVVAGLQRVLSRQEK
jgi:hypothetical protein